MNLLLDPIYELEEFKELNKQIEEGISSIYLHGIVKESLPHIIYALYEKQKKSFFVVLEDELVAKKIYESMLGLKIQNLAFYPKKDISFYNISALESDSDLRRIEIMSRLAFGEKLIVITSVEALKVKISTKEYFKSMVLEISSDMEVNPEKLKEKLVLMDYERVESVESKGQFAIRGGIVDIYPLNMDKPVRMELFDTEIDSIRSFNIQSQRSIENLDSFKIIPAREFLITERDKKSIITGIEKDIERAEKSYSYNIDKERLIEKFSDIKNRLEEDLRLRNFDLLMPYIKENSYSSIIDYLDEKDIVVFDDIARIYDRSDELERYFQEELTRQIEQGQAFNSHEKIQIKFKDNIEKVKKLTAINITQLAKRTRILNPQTEIKIISLETESYNRNISVFSEDLKEKIYKGYKIIILAQREDKAMAIVNMLETEGLRPRYSEDLDSPIRTSELVVCPYFLSRGFEYRKLKIIYLTLHEIYGVDSKLSRKKKRASVKKSGIISYTDLQEGDFIVHENHGIGVFRGISQIEVAGKLKDYLLIEYRSNDKLYIPVDQMDMVQKYIGDKNSPKLSRLGTDEWAKSKSRAKAQLKEIADDIVKIYARRQTQDGYAFSKDTPWQREFESSFIYEETGAQLRCIEEIKADMEKKRPMDRLLCGDVGYGKTEVALRAAFKAVMDGKQVAILAPTTILALQHFRSASDRYKNFPVKIEMLSRFRDAKRQKEILRETKKGYIDILIGTHKILSKSLEFNDLGLLIVDEEQRFGVRHKDKLKELSQNIDVLMLSATPIPRSLQMGLSGIRDMSILDEAPGERYPTTTYVLEYDSAIIREAILKELERDGQVYIVYNKVMDIDLKREEIEALVPEAKIAVGHGQMNEKALEDVMTSFTEGEYDILLSTTIIETGMDIHNVNTMIILNADIMGLSQLYQLKGRIGRGDRTSFAYFTYEKGKSISEISEKRLKAIRDFTEFGSGFKIAMRDLELRGAGSMLGEVQHGHIESIGYELYVKYLEEAIKMVKGESTGILQTEILVDVKIDTYIPSDYINSQKDKIECYKRIANIESKEEFDDMVEELLDRFGEIPKSVINIMSLSLLKKLAQEIGFTSIKSDKDKIIFGFEKEDLFTLDDYKNIMEEYPRKIELSLAKPMGLIFLEEKNILNRAYELLEYIKKLKLKKIGKKITKTK